MASPILKTEAIALRVWPYSENSCVVSWLSRDHGRIATVVKSAYRPRSGYLGQIDLFFLCEVLYYQRPTGDLHIARECTALKTRESMRTDWKAVAAAAYLTDLTARALAPEVPQPAAFRLLDTALDDLAQEGAKRAVVFWYELKLLEQHGFAPRLGHCVSCGCARARNAAGNRFSSARGGLLCAPCAERTGKDLARMPPDVLGVLAGWQASTSPRAARQTLASSRQLEEIEPMLGSFIAHHLDMQPPSRPIALDLLSRHGAEKARTSAAPARTAAGG